MPKSLTRELVLATILAVLTAFLFRCWLIYPILKYMTINQARCFAIFVAVFLGAASGLLRLQTYTSACAIFVGLIASGIWLSLFPPMHDVATSFVSEFHSYLELFWREIICVNFAAVISNLASLRLVRKTRKLGSLV